MFNKELLCEEALFIYNASCGQLANSKKQIPNSKLREEKKIN